MTTSLKKIPQSITSYDLLKMAAVLLMFVDHVGDFFFEEELWFRVAGRMCVPMWFFLIGYARSRDLGVKMWGGMIILVLMNMVVGLGVLPLNILGTMIFIRLVIDPFMARTNKQGDSEPFWAMSCMLLFLVIPTYFVSEYGVLALTMAVCGYMLRLYQDGGQRHGRDLRQKDVALYFFFAYLAFVGFQSFTFGFATIHIIVLAIGIAFVMIVLFHFRPVEFYKTTDRLPGFVVRGVHVFGRRTLEIYVLHLLVLKILALIMVETDRFELFRVAIFPHNVMQALGWGE